MTIRWAPQATEDARDIWRYIAADDKHHADGWFDRLLDKLDTLAANPGLGRTRGAIMADLRSAPLGNYVLFYRSISNGIEVVRVLHSARDLSRAFRG